MKPLGLCLKIGLLIILVGVFGCATTLSPAAQNIRPADYSMVKDCTFLGDVQGSSGWGNLAASQGMQNAKNEAKEQAAQLGATHIVWENIVGGYSPFATGKAYKCR
jgi:Domain of unknown function (DUF4156)